MLFYLETNSKSCKIYLLATMKYILWFNFIHGSNLFSFVPNSLSYHNQKQKKVKFEPRIKLNHNIYMVCLLFATVYWYKSLQFVKRIKHNTLTLFIYDFIGCFDYYITPGYYLLTGAQVLRCDFPSPIYIMR